MHNRVIVTARPEQDEVDRQDGDTDEEAEDETVRRTDEGDNDNNDCDRRHGQQTNVTGYTDTKRM